MNVVRFFYLLCFCSVLFCCKSTSRKQSSGEQTVKEKVDTVSRIHIKYAKGFWLEEREGYVVLNIKDPRRVVILITSTLWFRVDRRCRPQKIYRWWRCPCGVPFA